MRIRNSGVTAMRDNVTKFAAFHLEACASILGLPILVTCRKELELPDPVGEYGSLQPPPIAPLGDLSNPRSKRSHPPREPDTLCVPGPRHFCQQLPRPPSTFRPPNADGTSRQSPPGPGRLRPSEPF